MKKGFTMIELIFVIVILGILASVAVPRLAGTKADAEESAAVANLRTLVNDANVYYVAKGSFGTATNMAKWKDITNVPLQLYRDHPITASDVATQHGAHLAADGKNCISIQLVDRRGTTPAYILLTKDRENKLQGLCKEIVEAEPVRAFLASTIDGLDLSQLGPTLENGNRTAADGAIAIGSSTTIY